MAKPGLLTLATAVVSRGGYLATFLYLHARLGTAGATAIVIASSAAALQVLGDPGLGLLLAARRELATARGTVLRSGLVQLLVAVAASVAAVLISVRQWGRLDAAARLLVVALLVVAVLECTCRVLRSPSLHCGQWGRYVAPELAFAVSRVLVVGLVPVVGVAGASGVAIGTGLAAAAALTVVYVRGAQPRSGPGYRVLLRMALPVGASTTLAAGYSQVQVPLIGWLASGSAASSYALAIRVVQATEIIPSSLCQIHLPGLEKTRSTRQVERSLRRQLAVLGCVLAVGLAAGSLALRYRYSADLTLVLIPILALSVPVKFVNYANASALVAYGRATRRLKASGIVAAVGLPLLALAAATGATVLGFSTVALEAVLLGMFLLALRGEGGTHAAVGVQRPLVQRERVAP